MTIYCNTKREVPECTRYPVKHIVSSVENMEQVTAYDHVCAKYEGDYRKRDFFICADASMFDVDNTESDNPSEWITPKEIREKFPDVPFYVCYSRNHMKEKNGKTARPKFHLYFPHEIIDDVKEYEKLKDSVCAYFYGFDRNAKDSARFFFGVEKPVVEFYEGKILLSDFMKTLSVCREDSIERRQNEENIIPEGQRNSTLCRFAAKTLTRWGDKGGKAYQLYMDETRKCRPLLEKREIESIWKYAVKFYHEKISCSPDYISPEKFSDQIIRLKPLDFTDIGQAHVFYNEYKNVTAYSVATGYLFYDGKIWLESEPKVHGLVQELTQRQLEESVLQLKKAQYYENDAAIRNDGNLKRETNDNIMTAKKYRNYVLRNRDTRRISAILREIQPMININVDSLDHNGFILNSPDGEIDLRTGKLNKHNPNSYCTKITKVSPAEKGKKLFMDFLEQITCGDKELQNYLQYVSGMSAVGKVYYENLILAYGNGKNGKSTFFNLISKVMGTYTGYLSSEIFLARTMKNKSPEFAELRGKRIVIVSELDEDKILDTAIMKKLCSTDDIYAEKKYKAPFSFIPSHTIVLCTNHLPRVNLSDNGTWRRLIVVPFKAVINSESEIKNYAEYLYEHAGSAVLSWIVEGAKKFLEAGCCIDIPKVVKEATEQYRAENDWLNNYISECCETGSNYEITAGELYQSYSNYCERTGEEKKSQQAFGRALTNAGYQKTRRNIENHTVRMWKGLRVIPLSDYQNNNLSGDSWSFPYIAPYVQKDALTDNDGMSETFPEGDVVF